MAPQLDSVQVGPETFECTAIIELFTPGFEEPLVIEASRRQSLPEFENSVALFGCVRSRCRQSTASAPAQAARLGQRAAASENGRRLVVAEADDRLVVRSPSDLAQVLIADVSWLEQETFVVVPLDTRNRVIGKHTAFVGSLSVSCIPAV